MNTYRIEEIQKQCACPDSQSVYTALCQVWNEVGQEYQQDIDPLKQQLEQAQARIGELTDSLNDMVYVFETNLNNLDSGDEFEDYQTAKSVLNKTPAQSPANIEARAVEKFMNIAERYIDDDQSLGMGNALYEFERQQVGSE